MSQHARPEFTYLGHATVRCDLPDGRVLLIDPWIESNPSCPEEHHDLGSLDALLITHAHFDHMGDAVAVARRYEPEVVVGCFEVCQYLESQGVENCSPMNLGGSQEVLDLTVSMVRADHSSGLQDGDRLVDGGVAAGYVVRMPKDAGGFTFYHSGDTALFSDMQLIAELHRPELAFLPIGDVFTMDPQQAARACRFLGVRRVIPVHWGTFPALTGTPKQLEQALSDQGVACETITLQPGESY